LSCTIPKPWLSSLGHNGKPDSFRVTVTRCLKDVTMLQTISSSLHRAYRKGMEHGRASYHAVKWTKGALSPCFLAFPPVYTRDKV
jgi:hypothetical protein